MTTVDIFNLVAASIREVEPDLESTPITPSDSMKLLGLDSVARVEVLMLAMENLGISVPNEDLVAAQNIGDLVRIFEQRLSQPG
jgi:polyketide biosynthesis acyl carrier protein